VYYNYRKLSTGPRSEIPLGGDLESLNIAAEHAAMTGTDVPTYTREGPGMSAFALSDGVVYHTYSTYARGLDVLWMYQWLDTAPNGRNETGPWFKRHDEYV
jgi:predicted dithiol-disulfide oxidoreductase (DUF899 family)